jgi:hypothetical protein
MELFYKSCAQSLSNKKNFECNPKLDPKRAKNGSNELYKQFADPQHFNANPDPAIYFNADPDTAPLQRNLRSLVYRPSRAPFFLSLQASIVGLHGFV